MPMQPPPFLQLLPPGMSEGARQLAELLRRERYSEPVEVRVPPGLRVPATLAVATSLIRSCGQGVLARRAVHAVGAAVLAAVRSRVPVAYTPDVMPTPAELAALRWIGRRTPIVGVTASEAAREALASAGLGFSHVLRVPPLLEMPEARMGRDNALREALGVGPEDKLIVAVGDSTREANHALAVWTAGVLSMLDRRWRLMLLGRGSQIWPLMRLGHEAHLEGMLLSAREAMPEVTFPRLLGAADVVLDTAGGPTDPWGLIQAVASEVPVLSTGGPAARELLPTELCVSPPSPRALARALLELTEDPGTMQTNLAAVQSAAAKLRGEHPLESWHKMISTLAL
jgi:glycosyltransferase involved in cell wall biosynthesis